MIYTLNHGVGHHGADNTQLSLLIGLPVVALLLTLGALNKHSPPDIHHASPSVIPVVSRLDSGGKSNGATTNSGNSGGALAGSGPQTAGPGGASAVDTSSTSTGSSSGVIGGRGGGPSGSTSSGILPLNTSLDLPPVNVQLGQKSLLNTSGTSVNLN